MRPAPIARRSLHAQVADRVRDRILARELAPSSRVDEVALCEALGISRTPLREALKVLASEGWVSLVPGKGAFVTALAPGDVDALFPVMALLEGRCTGEAVRRMTAGDARRLAALHERLERLAAEGEVEGYYAVNFEVHQLLETLSGNPWLIRVTAELRRFLRLSRGSQLHVPGRLQASLREPRKLRAAIARRDAAAAERLMNGHLLAQQRAWRTLHADAFAPGAHGNGAPGPASGRARPRAAPAAATSPAPRSRPGAARRRDPAR